MGPAIGLLVVHCHCQPNLTSQNLVVWYLTHSHKRDHEPTSSIASYTDDCDIWSQHLVTEISPQCSIEARLVLFYSDNLDNHGYTPNAM